MNDFRSTATTRRTSSTRSDTSRKFAWVRHAFCQTSLREQPHSTILFVVPDFSFLSLLTWNSSCRVPTPCSDKIHKAASSLLQVSPRPQQGRKYRAQMTTDYQQTQIWKRELFFGPLSHRMQSTWHKAPRKLWGTLL